MVVQRRSLGRAIWRSKAVYLYLVPTFALLAVFGYYPPLSAFYHAFFTWDGVNPGTFVGLGNFAQMLHDPVMQQSVPNMIALVLASLIVGLTVPLLVAELLFGLRSYRASYLYRLLFVIPIVVPTIISILLWQFIYDPNTGLLNAFLGLTPLGNHNVDWLTQYALYALVFIGFPWVAGVNVLIYLSGLQSIPTEVIEAAQLDGATGWRRLRSIDLPLVTGQIKILVVLILINGIQGFGLQFVLTQGGPGYNTMVPGYYMYQTALQYGHYGYGCAIGLTLFLVILALTYINLRYVRSSVEYEAS